MKHWMKRVTLVAVLAGLAGSATAGDGTLIYPVPRSVSAEKGALVVSKGNLAAPSGLSRGITDKIKDIFRSYADVTLSDGTAAAKVTFIQNVALHDQGYSLKISEEKIEVGYKDDAGAFYAATTLKQLLFQHGKKLPCLTITDDYPDFPNRGFMWDISRNKIPTVATIKRVIDIMADLKLNQLQLYIEGYPFAYASYPDVWKHGTPLTPADFKEIDAYCTARYIYFVPNQNSYAHMYAWLALPQFQALREVPEKNGGSTVALSNPETITFLKNLYGDLLPNFTSGYFNIGGDESDEVGTGQGKAAYPDLTKAEIYLEGLKSIHGLVTAEKKIMMFWADMIIGYAKSNPAIVKAAKEALPNAIAMDWGYEFDRNFERSTTYLKEAGFPFYVAPGTATWGSYIGRTSNMTKNLENAAVWGKKNGAIGYLLTTWGDQGHNQNLICEYPPLAYAAGLSWNGDGNRQERVDYNQYVSRFIFQDSTEELSAKLSELADYGAISPRCWNQSWIKIAAAEGHGYEKRLLEFIKFQKGASEEEKQAKALSQAEQVVAMCEAFLAYLPTVTIKADDGTIVRAELENSGRMLKAAADYTAMRLRIHNGVSTSEQEAVKAAKLYHEYKPALNAFKEVWLMRNKRSLLDDTIKYFYPPLKYFKHISGNPPYKPLADGNLVLLTPDTLTLPLASDEVVVGWVWSLSGSGEPVLTSAFGVNNATQINGAITDGVIALIADVDGISGKAFAFNPTAALQKGYYAIYGDADKTKLLPRFGWPVLFVGNGDYQVTFKAKFKKGAVVQKNLALAMTAAKPDGTLKDLSPTATTYSEPGPSGWVTVTAKYVVSDDIQSASFCISTVPTVPDTLYIAEIFMSRVAQ